MTLQITITEDKDTVIMAPAGKIDGFSIGEFHEGIRQVKETGKSSVIFLFKDLEYINSRGIGALLSYFKWIKDAGGVVRLAEVPPKIMELLNPLGLEGLAGVYPTLPEAMENSSGDAATKEVHTQLEDREAESFGVGLPTEKSKMPYMLAGAGIVIVAILFYLFFEPTGRTPNPESGLSPKLDGLERRVAQLEGRGKAFSQLDEKVESLSQSMSERITQIEKDLTRLKAEAESAKTKKEEIAAAPKKEQDLPAQASYHIVSKGDTLFRIALRYNMTVEEVRRMNNLKSDQAILPGQRLLVKLH
jgi:anti-sigma B factor antagonist